MKAVVSPLGILDASITTPENDADEQSSARGEGFDAVLALVASQSASATAPVKVLAPSVGPSLSAGLQTAVDAEGKEDGSARLGMQSKPSLLAAGHAVRHVDVTPTQAFEPWLGASPKASDGPANAAPSGEAAPVAAREPTTLTSDVSLGQASASEQTPAVQTAAASVVAQPAQVAENAPASTTTLPTTPGPVAKANAAKAATTATRETAPGPAAPADAHAPIVSDAAAANAQGGAILVSSAPLKTESSARPGTQDEPALGRKGEKATSSRKQEREGDSATLGPRAELTSPAPTLVAMPNDSPRPTPLAPSDKPRTVAATAAPESRVARTALADAAPAATDGRFAESLATEREPLAAAASTTQGPPAAGARQSSFPGTQALPAGVQALASNATNVASQPLVQQEPSSKLPDVQAVLARATQGVSPGTPDAARVEATAVRTLVTADAQTGAVVTHLEVYETSPSAEPGLEQATDLQPESSQARDEGRTSGDSSDQTTSGESAEQQQFGDRAQAEPRMANQIPFQATEAQGMRGLDAVVASLLRTGAAPADPTPRGASASRQLGLADVKVATGKSASVRLEEKLATVTRTLSDAELQREEERLQARELLELGVPQLQLAEPQAEPAKFADAAPVAAPVVVPAHVPDPDAAMMGKLARGESLNAAISIEHPELGSMDVLVQSENGRVDVRAVMDTPRAAAVLRAHESALRYGIQQAGMTFGALRVRARTGEAQTVKARDTVKRRRGNEWEA